MDKKKLFIITAGVITFILAVGGVSLYLISRDAMVLRSPLVVQEKAKVTYASGSCLYMAGGSEEWVEAVIGQNIRIGDSLKTLDDGEMDLRFSQKTLMRMDGDTILKIDNNTLKNLTVDLDQGRLYAKFEKIFRDQLFNVISTNAVAGIRGTDLVFEVSPDRTDVFALSGITEIHNKAAEKEKILLAYQKKTTIVKENPPSQPMPMTPQEIEDFQRILNLIYNREVVHISDTIQFQANSAEILPSSYSELQKISQILQEKKYTIEISGHTANVGSSAAMYALSVKRAQAIKVFLIDNGIKEERLVIKGYGGSKPIADNETDEGKARNRRVEFLIVDY